VSKHPPLEAVVEYLERAFNEPVALEIYRGSTDKAERIIEFAEREGINYILMTLPLWVIYHAHRLGRGRGIDILYSVMKPIKETRSRTEAEILLSQDPKRRVMMHYENGVYKVSEFVGVGRLDVSLRLLPILPVAVRDEARKAVEDLMINGKRIDFSIPNVIEAVSALGILVDSLSSGMDPEAIQKIKRIVEWLLAGQEEGVAKVELWKTSTSGPT